MPAAVDAGDHSLPITTRSTDQLANSWSDDQGGNRGRTPRRREGLITRRLPTAGAAGPPVGMTVAGRSALAIYRGVIGRSGTITKRAPGSSSGSRQMAVVVN